MVVIDTCAVIELCKERPVLSLQTQKKIYSGSYILSVSFAEIAYKVKSKRLEIGINPEDLYTNYATTENIEIVNIGVAEWFDAIHLNWNDNKDPVDRLITAFAIKKGIPIVSKDAHIKKFYNHTIW